MSRLSCASLYKKVSGLVLMPWRKNAQTESQEILRIYLKLFLFNFVITNMKKNKMRAVFISIFYFILISGCGSQHKHMESLGTDTVAIAKPSSAPTKTITSFTESLQCMDTLLLNSGLPETLVSMSLSSYSDNSVAGMEDMVMTALSVIGMKSNKIKVVTKSPHDDPFSEHFDTKIFKAPDLFIRLSPVQLESDVQSSANSGSFNYPGLPAKVSLDTDRNASIISIDMNMGRHDSQQLIPGVFSRNSISIFYGRSNGSLSVGNTSGDMMGGGDMMDDGDMMGGGDMHTSVGSIFKFGTDFRFKFTYREGIQSAVRTLIELGIIELIGKYTNLPYRKCLNIAPARKETLQQNEAPERPAVVNLKPIDMANSLGYKRNDEVVLKLSTSSDLYINCYYQLFDGSVYKIFPNKYRPDNFVPANADVFIPSDTNLHIEADSPGPDEIIQCVGSDLETSDYLPSNLLKLDFKKLPYSSVDELRALHLDLNNGSAFSDIFTIRLAE